MHSGPATETGFTLIELLIVIAIIAIIAASLVPNLLAARATALERAAQSYSADVTTALVAVLASDPDLNPTDVAGGTFNCGAGAAATVQVTVNGTVYPYGWGRAPVAVTSCTVTGDDSAGTLSVSVDTAGQTYVNGL